MGLYSFLPKSLYLKIQLKYKIITFSLFASFLSPAKNEFSSKCKGNDLHFKTENIHFYILENLKRSAKKIFCLSVINHIIKIE